MLRLCYRKYSNPLMACLHVWFSTLQMQQDIRLWFAAVFPRRSRQSNTYSSMSITRHKVASVNSSTKCRPSKMPSYFGQPATIQTFLHAIYLRILPFSINFKIYMFFPKHSASIIEEILKNTIQPRSVSKNCNYQTFCLTDSIDLHLKACEV